MSWGRRRMAFEVQQGQIAVDFITVLCQRRGVLVVDVETAQRYPVVLTFSSVCLYVGASEHTLSHTYDPAASPTRVGFPPGSWEVVTETMGRYNLRFALYRPGHQRAVFMRDLSSPASLGADTEPMSIIPGMRYGI